MHSSDEEWWGQWGHCDLEEGGTTPHEVHALREYIEGQSEPLEAAKCLMTLREDQVPCDGDWDKGGRISWLIFDACMWFREKIPVILDLVDAVRAMPDLGMTDEQKVSFKDIWQEWKYLAEFDTICKTGYERRWETRYPADLGGGPGRAEWVSANFLMANHCIRNTECFFELHRRGFKTIITTLEQDPWNHAPVAWNAEGRMNKSPRDCRTHEYSVNMLNTNVLGLAPWFTIAGRLIYNYVDEERNSMMRDNKSTEYLKYPDSNLWYGKPRYSKERWAFWKERLEWISQQEELLKNTRDISHMIVNSMEAIEKDPQTESWKDRVDRDPFG